MPRKSMVPYLFGGLTLTALGMYAHAIERRSLRLTRIRLPIANLPPSFEGYRFVHLTDFHIDSPQDRDHALRSAELTLDLAPDLILLTGDYVSKLHDAPLLYSVLEPLSAPDGVYTTFGNHDHWAGIETLRAIVRECGISELTNTHVSIRRGEEAIFIAGVDDIWLGKYDLAAALHGIPKAAPTILLAHEPDFADEVALTGQVDLQLSGHTHGGQVRFPLFGIPFGPYKGRRYKIGMYKVGGMRLYTNRGVGTLSGIPFRLNCPPEVAEFTLVRP